jgi:hypothetical protein
MGYRYETFTVERDPLSGGSMGGAPIVPQHALDTALNTAAERGSDVFSVTAGPDYFLVVLRRGDADAQATDRA